MTRFFPALLSILARVAASRALARSAAAADSSAPRAPRPFDLAPSFAPADVRAEAFFAEAFFRVAFFAAFFTAFFAAFFFGVADVSSPAGPSVDAGEFAMISSAARLPAERGGENQVLHLVEPHPAIAGGERALEHPLELLVVDRTRAAGTQQVAVGLGGEAAPRLEREHAVAHRGARLGLGQLLAARLGERQDGVERGRQLLGRHVRRGQPVGQVLERELVAFDRVAQLEDDAPEPGLDPLVHAEPSSLARWHFLYFLPLPHGHGSLRPARRAPMGARRGAAAAGGRGVGEDRRRGSSPSATATPPVPAASNALAASALLATMWMVVVVTGGGAGSAGSMRKMRRTDSSSTSVTSCSNILNASPLYSSSGSFWP